MTTDRFMRIALCTALCTAAYPLSAEANAPTQLSTVPLLLGECQAVSQSLTTFAPPSLPYTGVSEAKRRFTFIVSKLEVDKDVWQLSTLDKEGKGLTLMTTLKPMRSPDQLIYTTYFPKEATPNEVTRDVAYSLVLNRANRDNAKDWYGHFTTQFTTKSDVSVSVEAVTCRSAV